MKKLLFSLTILVAMTSCATKYVLNTPTVNKYQLSAQDLTQIQFFNSQDIVLTRYENSQQNKSTTNGTLSLQTGNQVDQVIIRANTPGKVVKQLENGAIAVSFEPDDNKYLIFGTSEQSDTYRLQAISWENSRGKINYGGAVYYTNAGADRTFVSFRLKRKHQENRNLRYAKGNRL